MLFAPLHPPLSLPLGEEFLEELCCRASLSPSPDVSRSAVAVLCEVVSLLGVEGDSGWGWVREGLVQKLPFIEVPLISVYIPHIYIEYCTLYAML